MEKHDCPITSRIYFQYTFNGTITIVAEIKAQETKEEPVKAEESKNFHGDNCKTCARMISAMGQVLPHPVNV